MHTFLISRSSSTHRRLIKYGIKEMFLRVDLQRILLFVKLIHFLYFVCKCTFIEFIRNVKYNLDLIDYKINWNKTLFRILIYACVMSWYIVPLYSSSYPRSNYIDRHRFTVTVLFIFELSSPFVVWPCVWLKFAPWLICVWCNISCFNAAAPVLTMIPLAFASWLFSKRRFSIEN